LRGPPVEDPIKKRRFKLGGKAFAAQQSARLAGQRI